MLDFYLRPLILEELAAITSVRAEMDPNSAAWVMALANGLYSIMQLFIWWQVIERFVFPTFR